MPSEFDSAFDAAFDGVDTTMPAATEAEYNPDYGDAPPPTTYAVVTTGTTPDSESDPGRREFDHVGEFNFVVEIDGVNAGSFQKCDGLTLEVDVLEYRDGLDPYPRKRPGLKRFGTLKLTKGYVSNTALWDWCKEVVDGKMGRKSGAIHVMDDDGSTTIQTFRFIESFPKRWNGFKLDGKGQGGLVEEIEIEVENFMIETAMTGLGGAIGNINPFS